MVQSWAADGSSPSFQDPARLCQTGTGAGESRKCAVGPGGSRRPLTSCEEKMERVGSGKEREPV